jgi:hypothetical protein
MPANSDFNQSKSDNSMSSFNKIHQGDEFDAMIQNVMKASSEQVSEDYGAAENMTHPIEIDGNFDEDLEKGSHSMGSSSRSDADALSLGSDDISVDSDTDDHHDSHDSIVSHVPLVNDDESVMELKNPAPVSQSVSGYVDQLNRREQGKSRLIKAGVFAIFIAVVVGIALAVVSVTGNREKGVGTGPNDQNSTGINAGDQNVPDNLFRSVEVLIDGTISLSGLVIPTGMLETVKGSLEKAIAETASKLLTQDQRVKDVIVTSIVNGGGRVLLRVLGDISVVVYEMTVEERCRDCDDKILQGMKETLYEQVVSDLIEAIDTGDFTDNLHKQAKTYGNSVLLSVYAIDADFERHSSQPTQPNNEVPEFTLPQLPPPPPTLPPSHVSIPHPTTLAPITPSPTLSPVTAAPATKSPISPSPTLSPVTAAPATKAPFALPPVDFAPTNPPVLIAPPVGLATPNPTKNPTNSPTLQPTPR